MVQPISWQIIDDKSVRKQLDHIDYKRPMHNLCVPFFGRPYWMIDIGTWVGSIRVKTYSCGLGSIRVKT